jgi:HEAT repeat protein
VIRILSSTVRFAAVTLAASVLVVSLWIEPAGAADPEDPAATRAAAAAADLRTAERVAAPIDERVAAVQRLVAAGPVRADSVDRALRVAASLVAANPAAAGALALAALDGGPARKDARDLLAAVALRAVTAESDAARLQDLEAVLLLAGRRGRGAGLLARRPPTALARAVVVRDAAEIALVGDAMPTAEAWAEHEKFAAPLDEAAEDDPKISERGLSALRALGSPSVPFLAAIAKPPPPTEAQAPGKPAPPAGLTPPGLIGRRVRAIVALGAIGDRSAVPALLPCIHDAIERHEDGWVRVAAVDALGDLGDPRALAPLCRVLFYLGDIHRPYDNWEYPGALIVPVQPQDWAGVENYAMDSAACNALLRLGVRGAAEWLIEKRLDPRTGRWRIRVTQDAVDAIRRAFPDAPDAYEPDAGFPQRQAGVDRLRAWWRTGPKLKAPLNADDPAVREALHAIADRIGGVGVGVMELQIVKQSAALLGASLTPSMLEVLATTTRKLQRAELAAVLGTVHDRRAIAPLIALSKNDPLSAVRANAAESLAAYADPEFPATFDGPTDVGQDAIVARWIEMLDDVEDAPKASAMKALSSVHPRADVVAALEAHSTAKHPEVNADASYRLFERVAVLVHAGTDLEGVVALTDAPDVFTRRSVWELLHTALRLDPRMFDPTPDPGAPDRKPLDRDAVKSALEKRRTP